MDKLIPIDHKNQRVLTTSQIAELYETETDNISKNFTRNLDRYAFGTHYFILDGEELKALKASGQIDGLPQNVNKIYLWTEKGALLHAKSLNTDKAWEMYQQLVDTYFRVKELQKPQCVEDLIIMQAQSMKELRAEVEQLQSTQRAIKEAVISEPDNWREDTNHKMNKISQTVGNKFQEVRSDSYKLLEQRAGVDLERRLFNKRARLLQEGQSKTAIDKVNKMDIIDEDKKLREIYGKIVSEYYIKYVA
jgi:hypothetical protein